LHARAARERIADLIKDIAAAIVKATSASLDVLSTICRLTATEHERVYEK